MKKLLSLTAIAALMVACGSAETTEEPGTPGNPVTPTTPASGVAPEIAGNLQSVTFDPDAETLQVTLTSLDGDTASTTYARDTTYDVPGYIAFVQQDDPLDRFFTGYAAESADGSSQAVLVVDGGQFNRFFGGANYVQVGAYTAPDSGLASYAGTYVGLLNIGTRDGTLPSAADPDLLPERAGQVTGDVFINVDFADAAVNGAITNRVDVDGVGATLDTVVLVDATLAANGSFSGASENTANDTIGSFAGVLGGSGATSMSGGIHLTGDFIPGIDNEQEYGIFVLNQCGTAGEAAICAGLDDVDE